MIVTPPKSLLLFIALLSAAASAQDGGDPTFRTKVDVVLVPVVVRDSSGRAVGNLTQEDFQLFDKGKRQTISSFSVLKNGPPPVTKAAMRDAGTPTLAAATPNAESAVTNIHPERYIAYVFDDLNTAFVEVAAYREAALRHFKSGFRVSDRAAIYTFSGRTTLEFTNNQAKLEDAVMKLRIRPGLEQKATTCPDVTYYLADSIVIKDDKRALEAVTRQAMDCMRLPHDMAENLAQAAAKREVFIGEQDTHVSLDTLKKVIRVLAQMPGERSLVLASSGFYVQTPEGIRGFDSVLDLAAKVKVTISTLNPRGMSMTGLADASRHNPLSDVEHQYYRQSEQAGEGVLADLAEGTGGTYFHNNNDLAAGFARVAAAPEFSYVLGFSPASLKADGSFHQLKIRLPGHKSVRIQARHGYYALKQVSAEENAAAELHDAVFSREEAREIPVKVRMQISKSQTGARKLTVIAKIDVGSLQFQKVSGRNSDSLTVVSALFDRDGRYVAGIRKIVNLRLRDETLAHLASGISLPYDFSVKPGTYLVRVVVRESEGKAMFSYNGWVAVP